jgi:hypothetical protein
MGKKMLNQKPKSGSRAGKTDHFEAQLRMALRDLRRPIHALDCVGIDGELTLEEWKARRDADYDELYKDPAIPPDLITAVKEFRGDAVVSWATRDGRPATPEDERAIPMVETQQKNSPQKNSDPTGDQSDPDDWFSSSLPKTACEALAMCLRGRLAALRESGPAPVRSGKMVPQSVIARIAVDMLPVGTQLNNLIRELLQVDRRSATGDREFAARHKATWIKAQAGDFGVRALAKEVGVNASTVTRWLRDPEFHNEISDRQRFIELARKDGIWPSDERGEALVVELRAKLVEARKHCLAFIESAQGMGQNVVNRLKQGVEQINRYIKWIDDAS